VDEHDLQTRVLVVDDDAQFLRLAAHLLAKAGIPCATADDIEGAWEMLAAEPFALVVADINMPGNRDLDFVKELAVERPDLPVLVVTGSPTLESAIGSANLNVAGYVVKPFTNAEFERAVRAAAIRGDMIRRETPAEPPRRAVLIEDVEVIKHALYADAAPRPIGIDEFVSLTATNIVQSFEDLRGLANALSSRDGPRAACHLFDCPRLERYSDAIEDTIAVLERTKGAFKSKELGELRKRLEVLIAKDRETRRTGPA
jgi:CheY-like chemotaxis protein